MGAFRHRDFRLLWFGALFSFLGNWIQNVAQGWLVYDLTGDKAKLALIAFTSSVPVLLFGPLAGTIADYFDKRRLLIVCQTVFAAGAGFLAFVTARGIVEFWHILLVAGTSGLASTVEMPVRQSIVSRVVPREDLGSAIPLQALTFNGARLVGPAVGGVLLAYFGPQVCYAVNALTYSGLVFAAMAIRANLAPTPQAIAGVIYSVTQGARHTLRDRRLRTLWWMEALVSGFGLTYLILMPAIARDVLGLGEKGLGMAMTTIGVGAIAALLLGVRLADSPRRTTFLRWAMTVMGLGLLVLSTVTSPYVAFPLFAILGFAVVTQFNTTNTMFQVLAPEALRGRVLAMHIWAISGLGAVGNLGMGWLAEQTSIQTSVAISGSVVLIGAGIAWTKRRAFAELREALAVRRSQFDGNGESPPPPAPTRASGGGPGIGRDGSRRRPW
ncbi:MAG: MFS transporter [Fimbriimonadaceae bacterium]